MDTLLTSKNIYQRLFRIGIILVTILCIFPPDLFLLKLGANFTVQIMLILFGLSLAFLALRDRTTMFVSFVCCAALCLFLKETTHPDFLQSFYPHPTIGASLKIAHFNVSSSNDDYEKTLDAILSSDADLISLQEVTPDWNRLFKERLSVHYPHNHTIVRIDPFGLAVYSKKPFTFIDTFFYDEIPNIVGSIRVDSTDREVSFISSHTTPLISNKSYEKLRKHLSAIAKYAKRLRGPILTFGDYSAVTWSPEIKHFRSESNLFDSRRDFMPTFSSGLPFLQIPIDHIFYSRELSCTSFKTIAGTASSHLGIVGTYQFKSKYHQKEQKKEYSIGTPQ